MNPKLSVIIVSFNTRELTRRCLENIIPQTEQLNGEVIVVDNASTDGTAEVLESFASSIVLIKLPENIGFGRANNKAFEIANGDLFLLLNTDCFPEEGCIEQLCEVLEGESRVGAVGPELTYENGAAQESVHAFPSPLLSWKNHSGLSKLLRRNGKHFIDEATHEQTRINIGNRYLKGACLLLRSQVYREIGGFDQQFFFYGEDADFGFRLLKAGWYAMYIRKSTAIHLEGGSGKTFRFRYTLHYFAGTDRFIRKHYGMLGLVLHRMSVLAWSTVKLLQCWGSNNPERVGLHIFLIRNAFTRIDCMDAAIAKVTQRFVGTNG